MAVPQQSGFARAKHLMRYLKGHNDTVLRVQPEHGEVAIRT